VSKVTRKGQVTIPKQIREVLDARPGSRVEFVVETGTVKLVKVKEERDPLSEAIGLFDDVEVWKRKRTEDVMRELRGR